MSMSNCNQPLGNAKEERKQNPFPDVYMPAMPPLGLITAIENWVRNWRRRRQLVRLLKYDDFLLEDIGHHRADLEKASRLSLRVDAFRKLSEWREQRRMSGLKS